MQFYYIIFNSMYIQYICMFDEGSLVCACFNADLKDEYCILKYVYITVCK